MSTYAGTDDCTDIVLDFISGGHWGDELGNPVGESNGNYNAYFGHVDSTVNLCAMNLDEIYQFQERMLDEDPRSTAIGRYQFLQQTLRGLQGVLPDSTLFTQELQDEFAVKLLVRRGYSEWWNDKLTARQFAHNLSCEWASLPDPFNGGKSHYDGDDAGNHASTTLDCVYVMLDRAAAEIVPAPGPDPEKRWLSASEAIKSIQGMLLHRGLLQPATPTSVDGIWGPRSQAALDELAAQAASQ